MSFATTLFRTAVLAALGTLALASQPVTVTMQDGSQIKGSFAGGSSDEINIVVAGQTLTLKTANIEAVKFDPALLRIQHRHLRPSTPYRRRRQPRGQGRPFPPIRRLWSA